MSRPQRAFSLVRLIEAAGYSLAGLRAAWAHEAAFRLELMGCLVAIPLGAWIGRTGLERAVLIGSVVLVPVIELINSAIEAAVDRIGPERHPLSKQAKDLGSAAVMVSLVNVAIVWGLIVIGR